MDLYNDQEFVRATIVSHATSPRNLTNKADIDYNSETFETKTVTDSCTDDITVVLKVNDNKISDAKFYGVGCVISTATTDMILNRIKNKTLKEVNQLIDDYLLLTFTGEIKNPELLGDLLIYKNVYKQANRISCAQTGAKSIKTILEKLGINDENI